MADEINTPVVITKKEAKALGLKHYFTGTACKRGHVAYRYVCGLCVKCCEYHRKKWRAENPERSRELRRQWKRNNPDREMEIGRKAHRTRFSKFRDADNAHLRRRWAEETEFRERLGRYRRKWKTKAHAENPRRFADYVMQWRRNHPERAKIFLRRAGAKWYAKNAEQVRAAAKKWRAENPDKVKTYGHNRRARKTGAGGSHTAQDVAEIFKAQHGRCAICRNKLKSDRQLDHIIPVSRGGGSERSNLQWTCKRCNQTKRARDPIDHMRSLGRLL